MSYSECPDIENYGHRGAFFAGECLATKKRKKTADVNKDKSLDAFLNKFQM